MGGKWVCSAVVEEAVLSAPVHTYLCIHFCSGIAGSYADSRLALLCCQFPKCSYQSITPPAVCEHSPQHFPILTSTWYCQFFFNLPFCWLCDISVILTYLSTNDVNLFFMVVGHSDILLYSSVLIFIKE